MSNFESQVRELFLEVVEKSPEEWQAFLDQRCDSAELRAAVQQMLDLRLRSSDFLSKSAIESYPSLVRPYGDQIAEFRLIRQIGKGGMGLVYLAEDTILKRAVAIKVVSHTLKDQNGVGERFRREARAAARLSHPGIVPVYRSGDERGLSYIAMEFVDGQTLRDRIESHGRKPHATIRDEHVRDIAQLIVQVADALDHAHRNAVIHRDVKPSNILIDGQKNARLTDFGIARITTEESLLQTGMFTGSYAYMSPEQARVNSAAVDHRTDIFSLGVVLYEALCQRRPFHGTSVEEIVHALTEGSPAPLQKICPAIPGDLAIICHKALERDVTHRYQTAAHLSADLRSFLDGRPILARPPDTIRLVREWFQKHQRLIYFTFIVVLTSSLIGVALLYRSAQRAAIGQLAVTADQHRGSKVVIAQYATDLTLEEPRTIGHAPVSVDLKPGLYRVMIEDGNDWLQTATYIEAGVTDNIAVNRPSPEQIERLTPIPGGTYRLGDPQSTYSLIQPRDVNLSPFRIASTEVSNREYRAFVSATRSRSPGTWDSQFKPNENTDNWPVVDISWEDAIRYCRWRGVRLPTPDEWEAAARDSSKTPYPWGVEPKNGMARKDSPFSDERNYFAFACDVDKHGRNNDNPEANPLASHGLMHMFSNVEEYTEGFAANRNNFIIVKGRSWADSPFHIPAKLSTIDRTMRSFDRGFRVAYSNRKDPRP